jgi:uncharacterized DUF497 family protein
MINFEWDIDKAKKNLKKHHVAFSEAVTIFNSELHISIYDPDHSEQEDRYLTIGISSSGRFLIVAHMDRGENTRIISARELTRKERIEYEKEIKRRNR